MKRQLHRALSRQVVHLVGSDRVENGQNAAEIRRSQGPEPDFLFDPEDRQVGKGGQMGVPGSPVDLVALAEEKFSQVSPVLPGHSADERAFHVHLTEGSPATAER